MKRETHIIDATDKILGRLASEIVRLLRGKYKSDFSPEKDAGDFVIVKNVSKIRLSGKKTKEKVYYHHTGYLGGLKETPFKKLFEKYPERVIKKAVWGMMPKTKLGRKQIKRLKTE